MVRNFILAAAAVGGALAACAAGAQPQVQALAPGADGARLILLCSGTDTVTITNARYAGGGYGVGLSRVPAQLGVMTDKGVVRVRPPATNTYMQGKPEADGWYVLEKPEISEFLIRGRSTGTGLLSSKLDVDRRTGAATFGDFSGVCRSVTTTPAGTVF